MKTEKIVIVAGGSVDSMLLGSFIEENMYIIGADKGLESLEKLGIKPDYALGDFDSANEEIRLKYMNSKQTMVLNPMKDYTDTHVALMHALSRKPETIYIFGATGSRFDHMMGNLQLLYLARLNNVEAYIIDTNNRICIINTECFISKEKQYGKYVSVMPFSHKVTGINMKGFVYELEDAVISQGETIGISNEIREEEGHISVGEGYLIVMETKD